MTRETEDAYRKLVGALKRRKRGATAADLVAGTALPLETVRDLLPRAADEYAGRLEVTESGEILYSFPQGFTSRSRGFGAWLGRALAALGKGVKAAAALFFKVWIMVMLVGYFVLFVLLALGAMMVSVAASSSGNNRGRSRNGGGTVLASGLFNTIIRIWFYSEMLKPRYYGEPERERQKAGKPLYRAIFSFVFGDGDPNARWDETEKKAVIAFIQAHRGVIAMPEFAAITGKSFPDADRAITAYCAEFGGSPEVTEAGTIVYRFDDLLRRADTADRSFAGLSGPLKRLLPFSSNEKKTNTWFSVINGVNLLFGGYFLASALRFGEILTQEQLKAASYFYGVTYAILSHILANPLMAITLGLGLVPLLFSVLFWLVPFLRFLGLKKDNETVKMENFRKSANAEILEKAPEWFTPDGIDPKAPECRPKDLAGARDRVIGEASVFWPPEIMAAGEPGADSADSGLHYRFAGLGAEKEALQAYRSGVGTAFLGKTVFDTDAPAEREGGSGEDPGPGGA